MPTTLDSTHDEVNIVALSLDYDVGFATLTSATSWAHHVNQTIADETGEYINFGFFQSSYGQNPRFYIVGHEGLDDKSYAQEFRLASKSGGTFDWLAGLFYKNETPIILENDYTPGALDYLQRLRADLRAGQRLRLPPNAVTEVALYAGPDAVHRRPADRQRRRLYQLL
jgi:hypothetical protein